MSTPINSSNPLASSIAALGSAARHGAAYLETLSGRNVAPTSDAFDDLDALDLPLPDKPGSPEATLALLARHGSPATTASAGGRFFGLVVGGALPASLGARVLASAWDQVVFNDATSAVGVKLEQVAEKWLLELLNLPQASTVVFTTGATMANFTCLAAARHALLSRAGWDAQKQGLWDAPRLRIVASEQIHVTVHKALAMLGMGTGSIEAAPCDGNGAIDPAQLPQLDERTLLLTQAGNVNSGACDPVGAIAARALGTGAWLHVDGAFGLWAAASPDHRHLLAGYEAADSWVTDGHKWLNTPYDCGIAICRAPQVVHAAMATVAPYLKAGDTAAPKDMAPEFSRSARGAEVWAALHSLGRTGVADLVDRCCENAGALAARLKALGFEILNEVVLNQVVATLPGSEDKMPALAEAVQQSGEAWFGPTVWKGRQAIRLSVSSWVTARSDVRRTIDAIKVAAHRLKLF